MSKIINLRKKHLDAICTKIAIFLVTETYTDEEDLREKLSDAVKLLDEVSAKCVSNDEKNNTTEGKS